MHKTQSTAFLKFTTAARTLLCAPYLL